MANPTEVKPVTTGLTRDDLLALVEAMRKSVKTETELHAEEQARLDRTQMQESLKQAEAYRLHKIKTCSHMRNNGSTTAVYISDLNRLYCQACSGWILPNEDPEIFNRIYPLTV